MNTEIIVAIIAGVACFFGGGGVWGLIIRHLDEKSGLKKLQKDMLEGFEKLHEEISIIKDAREYDKAITSRVRIIRFSDEVTSGTKHSKESFYQVLTDIDEYENYCELHPRFENNRTVIATKRIKDVYAERLEKNDFL